MTISTQCTDRKDMVRAISEHTETPAVYLRTPTYAFQIGSLMVNRDGSITGEQDELKRILPLLREHGFLTEEPEMVDDAPADLEAVTCCEEVDQIDVTLEIHDWTIPQLTNLMRMLCSKQYLIRKMLRTDDLRISRRFVEELERQQHESLADFEAQIQKGLADGVLQGMNLTATAFTLVTPCDAEHPENWKTYAVFAEHILKQAKTATRVRLAIDEPENEKYAARAFLLRLGFGGTKHKADRALLLDHLSGYAAFKDDAGMQAHLEKLAAKRKAARKEADT